jgi:hypothetical protein
VATRPLAGVARALEAGNRPDARPPAPGESHALSSAHRDSSESMVSSASSATRSRPRIRSGSSGGSFLGRPKHHRSSAPALLLFDASGSGGRLATAASTGPSSELELGSPWRVSLPARASAATASREVLQRRPGAGMADDVGHLVAAVGIGVPGARRKTTVSPGRAVLPARKLGWLERTSKRSSIADGFAVGADTPRAARANRRHRRQRALDRLRARRGETWRGLRGRCPTLAD